MKNLIVLIAFLISFQAFGQKASDLFDIKKMEYIGSKIEQAELLLKNVKMWGKIDSQKLEIDTNFKELFNSKINFSKEQLKTYLADNSITKDEICGSIDKPISSILLNGKTVYAKYFVIHDLSSPTYENAFPNNINEDSWSKNNLTSWNWKKGSEPSHSIITRTGKSKTLNDFNIGWRATKFENQKLGTISRGLFLHIELLQPRVYPPGNVKSAPVAPTPGFTESQYRKLALLYVCASTRKGEWLIPAYHANIDNGFADGHDDPQNFDLKSFTDSVVKLCELIEKY